MSQMHDVREASTPGVESRLVSDPRTRVESCSRLIQQMQQVLNAESGVMAGLSRSISATPVAKIQRRSREKPRASTFLEKPTDAERIERRRAINRDSQRRIRERRAQEIESLRVQCLRHRCDKEQILSQVECINAEKVELLRQVQEITAKWQRAIEENVLLNNELLHLQSERTRALEIIQKTNSSSTIKD